MSVSEARIINHESETILSIIREFVAKHNRPIMTQEIFFHSPGRRVISNNSVRKTLIFLEKAEFVIRIDSDKWKPIVKDSIGVKHKTVDEKIVEVVRDFQKEKMYNPTSSEIVERYENMFGKPPLKDMGRHIRDLAMNSGRYAQPLLKRGADMRYCCRDKPVNQSGLGRFVKS